MPKPSTVRRRSIIRAMLVMSAREAPHACISCAECPCVAECLRTHDCLYALVRLLSTTSLRLEVFDYALPLLARQALLDQPPDLHILGEHDDGRRRRQRRVRCERERVRLDARLGGSDLANNGGVDGRPVA